MTTAISRAAALLLAPLGVLALLDWTLPQAAWQSIPAALSALDRAVGAEFWTLPLLIALQAATVVAIPIPAGPFTLANVAVAGPWAGFALSLVGTATGSVAAFLLGRRYGWALVRRLGGSGVPAEPDLSGTGDGLWLLPVLCVPVPLGGDVACFLAGIGTVRLRRFVPLAVLGRIPGTALGVLLASGLTTGSAVWLVVGMVGFAALFTAVRYRRKLVRISSRRSSPGEEVELRADTATTRPSEQRVTPRVTVRDHATETTTPSIPHTTNTAGLPRPLAFALGAGGSHGAIQLGQLRALEEAGIRPDLLIGCSVGALNAAALAADPTRAAENLDSIWRALRHRDVFTRAIGAVRHRRSLCDQEGLVRLIERLLPARPTFEDLAVPLHVVATDTATRRTETLSRGPVLPALLASCAVPAVFPAMTVDGRRLVDGGIRHDLPVAEAVKLGAASVIALPTTRWPRPIGHRASKPVAPPNGTPPTVLVLDGASPPGTGWTFRRTEAHIIRGYEAARAQLDAIRERAPREHSGTTTAQPGN